MRADWFLATATRPPLYERLLDIPDTLDAAGRGAGRGHQPQHQPPRPDPAPERDAHRVPQLGRVRAQPHHGAPQPGRNGGYLWVSYDFNSSEDRADIRENPLGPESRDERNFQNTFHHAGGEVIYSLPNGLQAYLLVDAAGNRIDLAPKDIVRDPRRRPGAVENGVSCISCHGVTGMNYPRAYDEIVKYAEEHRSKFPSIELTEIRNLYPTNGAEVLTADANRYLAAKDAAGGGRSGFGVVEYDDFINLVGQYEAEVGMRAAAIELETSIATVRQLVQSGRNEDQLPLTLADPLVSRDDFICRYRSLAPRVVRNAQFCSGTFTDADRPRPLPVVPPRNRTVHARRRRAMSPRFTPAVHPAADAGPAGRRLGMPGTSRSDRLGGPRRRLRRPSRSRTTSRRHGWHHGRHAAARGGTSATGGTRGTAAAPARPAAPAAPPRHRRRRRRHAHGGARPTAAPRPTPAPPSCDAARRRAAPRPTPGPAAPLPTPVCATATEIADKILTPKCGTCHGKNAPAAGLDLVTTGIKVRLLNVAARGCGGKKLVTATDQVGGHFFDKLIGGVANCGGQMPFGAPPLSAQRDQVPEGLDQAHPMIGMTGISARSEAGGQP